ncbi:MAG TPA: hypothetical protein VGL19_14195 [Polyangiaceae bacterium]
MSMFQITPSNEFATWFEALAPELAEEVACALDLLAEAGVALGPSRTSRALLWYDGCAGNEATGWDRLRTGSDAPRSFDDVREVLLWHREIVRCLESTAFRERLARLQPQVASLALVAVENLKVRLKAARARTSLQSSAALFPRSALATLEALTAREARVLAERFAPENALKEPFFEVLRLVGLEPTQMMNSPSGLCELTIASTEPRLRVLFGLDAPGQRIVALVGEELKRSYYGDSVQLAERRWLSYCSSPAQPPVQAHDR